MVEPLALEILNNTFGVICKVNNEGNFIDVNLSSNTLWGYSNKELIGKALIEVIAPQDIEHVVSSIRRGKSDSPNGFQFDSRIKRKNGNESFYLFSASWSEENESLYLLASDISERKDAEESIRASEIRIRKILNNLTVALVVVNEDGFTESFSQTTEEVFGHVAAEFIGTHSSKLFDSMDNIEIDQIAFFEDLVDQTLNKFVDAVCRRKNNEIFPVLVCSNRIKSHEGHRYLLEIIDRSEDKNKTN